MKITSDKEYYKALWEREEIFDSTPEGNVDLLLSDTVKRLGELTTAISEWEEEQDKEEPVELDKSHWHEALDRTDMIRHIMHNHLCEHPVISQNPDLKKLVDRAVATLGDLYAGINAKTPEE